MSVQDLQDNAEATHVDTGDGKLLGGITGKGFLPGQSGNPGGRPKGLARRVREILDEQARAQGLDGGENGELIIQKVIGVLLDQRANRKEILDAASWLADRGWGRPAQPHRAEDPEMSLDQAVGELSPDERKALESKVAGRLRAMLEAA